MVKVTVIRDDDNKRILRCSEGNRVWYRLWINPEDMMRIEPLLDGGDRIWMEELEMYYLFFYEINNGRRVLGKGRIKEILDTLCKMNARDVRSLASLCVLWACGICVFMVPLNTRSSKVVVLNGGNGYVKINIQK